MPFIGNKPTAIPLSADDLENNIITSAKIVDGTIATADIADANVTAAKLASGTVQNQSAFKNIIINGDMSIAQRGTSTASITTSGYYTVDRFNLGITTLGTWTQSQDTDVPTGQGFAKSLKMDCTTADGSPGSNDVLQINYKMEGQQLQYLKKGTSSAESTTLSFWIKATKTGTNIVELFDLDNGRQISKSYTVSSSNTWEKKTITFAGDTSGAFGNDNAASLQLDFFFGAGSNYTSGTLNTSWNSNTTANRAVGQVNHADSTSNNIYITGVQLEAGTTASDFEFLPFDINFYRCARYYQKVGINTGQYTFMPSHSDGWSGQAQLGVLYLPYTFRANATTEYSGSWTGRGALNSDNNCVPGGTLSRSNSDGTATGHQYRFSWNANQNSTSLGTGAMYYSNASTNDLAFDAEL
jgi:hypothetical protein